VAKVGNPFLLASKDVSCTLLEKDKPPRIWVQGKEVESEMLFVMPAIRYISPPSSQSPQANAAPWEASTVTRPPYHSHPTFTAAPATSGLVASSDPEVLAIEYHRRLTCGSDHMKLVLKKLGVMIPLAVIDKVCSTCPVCQRLKGNASKAPPLFPDTEEMSERGRFNHYVTLTPDAPWETGGPGTGMCRQTHQVHGVASAA